MEDEQSHKNPDGEILGEKAGLIVINNSNNNYADAFN